MAISDGCLFKMLYVKGMIMTIAAGGAFRDNRERRLINDASNVAGKCLVNRARQLEGFFDEHGNYVELRNTSVNLKNLARCFE